MSDQMKQDAGALRRYIDLMQKQSGQWGRMLQQLSGDTRTLAAKWQDQDFHHFDRHVRGLSANLETRIVEIKKQAAMLNAMADRLQKYTDI
jgi:uncharacterized protein YukE